MQAYDRLNDCIIVPNMVKYFQKLRSQKVNVDDQAIARIPCR